ncbi:MAG TPA: TolC family protein, partial [Flavisolibacter sp.]|nr:TolC family protein [Flavisolibacter sp.]
MAVVLLFISGWMTTVKAQRRLALQEAVALSLKNSRQLAVCQARIEEAVAATRQAVEARLPGATASASYLFLSSPLVNFKLKTPGSDSSGGVGQTRIHHMMYAMLNASLPIYAGGRIRYGIESAQYLEKAARLSAENDQEDIAQNTIEAYNNLYKAQEAIALVDSSLSEARERVRHYNSLLQNGLLARNDLLKAQLQESNTELALLEAENNWQLATVNMNILLGLPDSTRLFIDNTAFRRVQDTRTISEWVQLALINRKDVQALAYRQRAAETGVRAATAESMPTIALTGGYTALDIPSALTVWNAANIGVAVQYNIANLWKRGNVDVAKARVKEAEAGREQVVNAIRLQVAQSYHNYLFNQKKTSVHETAVAQAEEAYRVVANKFSNGLATVTDVLDADVARLQARLN